MSAASLLLSLVALLRSRRARRRTPGDTAVIRGDADELDAVVAELSAIARKVEALEAQGARSIQHVGVVRFNPFPDTGGNQSFAVAVLNAVGNGVVLSSLHSRAGTRVYLKQVADGRAETALSTEEEEAIRRAGVG